MITLLDLRVRLLPHDPQFPQITLSSAQQIEKHKKYVCKPFD